MAKITLKGDQFVREITTWETNGDQTIIQFQSITTEPIELSSAEKQIFLGP